MFKLMKVNLSIQFVLSSEFDLISRVVEAEIGGGDFNAKCNVASTIINRWRFYAPRTWNII